MFYYIIQFLMFLSLFTLANTLFLVLKNRKYTGRTGLILIISAAFIWLFGSYFEILSSDAQYMLLWRNITQIGVCIFPASMFYFSLEYIPISSITRKVLMSIIAAIAITAVILLWTDPMHHLMRISTDVVENRLGSIIKVHSTTFGLILMSYVTASHLISEGLLIFFLRNALPRVRKQLVMFISGLSFPIIFILLKNFFPSELLLNIPSAVSFIPMSVFIWISVFNFEKKSFSPVVMDQIFDVIDEIIVISDPGGTVIDLNKNAEALFSLFVSRKFTDAEIGDYSNILQDISLDWYDDILKMKKSRAEFSINIDNKEMHFDVSIHPLNNSRHHIIGCISVVRDVTAERRITENLISLAETDGLTGCLNKTAFQNSLENKLSKLDGASGSAALMMIDLDFFKFVNDNYGHDAGDRLLETVSGRIRNVINPEDLFGRLGGEEFGVFITGVSKDVVTGIAERIRKTVKSMQIEYETGMFSITASLGCSMIEINDRLKHSDNLAKELLKQADKALYRAKDSGRDRVCWFER